jgi:Na+-transporting methylmalonyl-CoA/oxaloacetate decarboxylase gamma subunit
MNENLIKALNIMLIGMTGVFLSLIFFSVMIWIMKKVDKFLYIKSSEKVVQPTKITERELDEDLIAVLTAAAVAILKKKIRITKIHFLDTPEQTTWASSGRMNIMTSHAITPKREEIQL